jgi:hypothetical protein
MAVTFEPSMPEPPPPPLAPPPPPSSHQDKDDIFPPPGGAYDPSWYVGHEAKHRDALHYLRTPGKPIVLWGPKAAGKTWLMKHVLDLARRQTRTCVLVDLDLQLFRPTMASLDGLLRAIAGHIAQRLKIDRDVVTDAWKSEDPATLKLTYLMEDRFLSQDGALVVLSIDQLDEILGLSISDDFFGMLRSWAESADRSQWASLRIAIAASTIKLTKDINKSPFRGLSEPIEIADLDPAQIETLAARYKLLWRAAEIGTLMDLVGGQPYLTRGAMYQAAVHRKNLNDILSAQSPTFAAHLDQCRRRLPSAPGVVDALAAMKSGRSVALAEDAAETLLRLGVVAQESRNRYRLRYRLYERL